ncbi:hypothetical protein JXC34_03185, partial [Candidatus Woesearchaeota archaeon]|nr:hypothetical protein [Candidatus Woesearchaeota archaeon]
MADSKGESIFDKIYYPELISISEPGRITSRGSDNYGKAFKKKRQVYLFERAFTDLQTSIMKKVGKKKAEEIFYRIGKDTGYRFMLLANMGKSRRYLVPIKLKLIFFMFRMFGFTLNEEILFDNKSMILKVRGKNNIFCSKTNEQGFSAGVVSGVYSVLVGKNIEAVKDSCSYDSDYCSVEANPKYKKRYIPKPKEI